MKHKARVYDHGIMQQCTVDYCENYRPVVNFITVRTLLSIAYIHDLPTECIYFLLAFPKYEFYIYVYMELPIGMAVYYGSQKVNVIEINISIYTLK